MIIRRDCLEKYMVKRLGSHKHINIESRIILGIGETRLPRNRIGEVGEASGNLGEEGRAGR